MELLLFRRDAFNVRLHEGGFESVCPKVGLFDLAEARPFYVFARLASHVATVGDALPHRVDKKLESPHPRSLVRTHVFNVVELASLKNTRHCNSDSVTWTHN